MGFKMKSSIDRLCGVSPLKRETAQSKKDKNDPLRKNIVDTSQKGDAEIRAKQDSKKTSKKIGPVESQKSIDKKREKVFTERDKARATATKDNPEAYFGVSESSKAAEKKYDESKAYKKR